MNSNRAPPLLMSKSHQDAFSHCGAATDVHLVTIAPFRESFIVFLRLIHLVLHALPGCVAADPILTAEGPCSVQMDVISLGNSNLQQSLPDEITFVVCDCPLLPLLLAFLLHTVLEEVRNTLCLCLSKVVLGSMLLMRLLPLLQLCCCHQVRCLDVLGTRPHGTVPTTHEVGHILAKGGGR